MSFVMTGLPNSCRTQLFKFQHDHSLTRAHRRLLAELMNFMEAFIAHAIARGSLRCLLLAVTLIVAVEGGLLQIADAQPTQGTIEYVDVDARSAEGAAIASLVRQQVLSARTATEFQPQAPLKRDEMAIALHKLLNPSPQPNRIGVVSFPDVQLGTTLEEAARAIAPYRNRQILCPGCALGSNFLADDTPSRFETAVVLVSILLAQHRIELVSDAERDRIASSVKGTGDLLPLARTYVATALKYKLLNLGPANEADLDSPIQRGDFAVQLVDIQQKFRLGR
jgi:hypothetical protein